MSIPRIDKTFTMEQLQEVGQRFLEAGYEYWEACHKANIQGAVIWLQGEDGKLCIFTRGEYRDQIMAAVDRIGPTRYFGATKDE